MCLFQAPGLCTLQMLPHWILAAVLRSGCSSYPCSINEETEAWTGEGSKVTEFSRKVEPGFEARSELSVKCIFLSYPGRFQTWLLTSTNRRDFWTIQRPHCLLFLFPESESVDPGQGQGWEPQAGSHLALCTRPSKILYLQPFLWFTPAHLFLLVPCLNVTFSQRPSWPPPSSLPQHMTL